MYLFLKTVSRLLVGYLFSSFSPCKKSNDKHLFKKGALNY